MTNRRLAFNADRPLSKVLVGVASNAAGDAPTIADDQDGWLQLAPYGKMPYFHEENGKWKQYTQVFERPQADAMVSAFNTLADKKGARFKGLPIYAGHPDCVPTRWPDESRFGGVMGLKATEDGLYVKPAWNDKGEKNLAEAYLVYPSPAWDYDVKAAKQTGLIVPAVLRSVGLTNSPRIYDSVPWVNSDDPGAPDAASTSTDHSQADANNPTTMIDHKKMLTGLLGLKDDASDEDIQSAHDAHMGVKDAKDKLEKAHDKLSKAYDKHSAAIAELEKQKTAANSELEAVRADLGKFRTLAATALLDGALNAGRITAAERPTLETAFNADFDAAKTTLDGRKTALNTTALGLRPNADDLSTPALRTYAYNSRANELKREMKLLTEDEVTRAMRDDPKGKAIITAMEAAK